MPALQAPLGIDVEQAHAPVGRHRRGEIGGEHGFAGATLLLGDRDDEGHRHDSAAGGSIASYRTKVFWFFFSKKNGKKPFFLKKEAKTSFP
jgi:hypothetical protein